MEQRDLLIQMAEQKREEWQRLLQEQRKVSYRVAQVKEYIIALNNLLKLEGVPSISLQDGGEGTGFAKPGNRSERMPPRKQQYISMSLVDASVLILQTSAQDGMMHVDQIAAQMFDFDPSDKVTLHIVKRSLVGSLAEAVQKGIVSRPAPGHYALPTKQLFTGEPAAMRVGVG